MARRIKALDESTVSRIAAGEIIIAPANALKELLENSIDAGSSSIEVVVKDGGLKSLQITDNGCGINHEDLDLLCQRFTTSKLQSFEELQQLTTYGFRGEALASISHVARLTVTTKTADSATAFKASYSDGVLKKNTLKPTAGKNGTQILVEDLFCNVPSRLKAFRSANEEYMKILDVVNKYSIHTTNVAFLCKRKGDTHPSLVTQANASVLERVRNVYGSQLANELLDLKSESGDNADIPSGLKNVSGLISNANYSSKKAVSPIFFVNHRLVTCDPLRRALLHIYSMFLPKGARPFIYMSLELDAKILDVNVHPTKREVRFLYEEQIVDYVCQKVQTLLSSVDTSRSYQTQTVLPVSVIPVSDTTQSSRRPEKRSYEYNLVRTDPKQSKIDWSAEEHSKEHTEDLGNDSHTQPALHIDHKNTSRSTHNTPVLSTSSPAALGSSTGSSNLRTLFTPTQLTSVKLLCKDVEQAGDSNVTDIVENSIYVGIVDFHKRLVAIQYDVKLLLMDYGALSKELFYQVGLSNFGNFGVIKFEQDLDLKELLAMNLEEPDDEQETLNSALEQLVEMNGMLEDYFSICITDDYKLSGIPMLLNGYMPPMSKLPAFLYNIATRVDWTNEQECFRGILNELSAFYIPEILENDHENDSQKIKHQEDMSRILEHTLFPLFKKRLIVPRTFLRNMIEIANLPGLYKVFERC